MPCFEPLWTPPRAGAHGVVDIRGRETTLLKEHVRSAGEALHRKRALLVELAAESSRLTAHRTSVQTECDRLEGDVTLALDGGRTDLARQALRLLLLRRQIREAVEKRLTKVNEEHRELETVVSRQEAALEELRARVEPCLAEWEADHFAASAEPVTGEQIDMELLRRTRSPADAAPGEP